MWLWHTSVLYGMDGCERGRISCPMFYTVFCVNIAVCLLASRPFIVGLNTGRARPTRRTDTSYAANWADTVEASAPAAIGRANCVQQQPEDKPSDCSIVRWQRRQRREVDATESEEWSIRTRYSASRSTRVTRWVTCPSRSVCSKRRALVAADRETLPAPPRRRRRHRSVNNISSQTARICTSGTRCPALWSAAGMTKSLTTNFLMNASIGSAYVACIDCESDKFVLSVCINHTQLAPVLFA